MIEFRYITVSENNKTINGFALCYDEAIEIAPFFTTLESGFSGGLHKIVKVYFKKNKR